MMTTTPPLDPFNLPLSACTLIEASAGTGKTYTIAMLYVRLVLGHKQIENTRLALDLTPRDILVVTYTEAATKELSDRIRLRLAQAADVFSTQFTDSDNPEYTDLVKFRNQQYPDTSMWSACQKRLLRALEYMDESAISTIHSWCYRMLSEHAFNSGSLFNVEMITDENDLLLEAVRDYWRVHVYKLPALVFDEFLSLYSNPEALMKDIKHDYKQSHYLGAAPGAQEQIKGALEQINNTMLAELDALKRLDWTDLSTDILELLHELKAKSSHFEMNGQTVNSMIGAIEKINAWQHSNERFPASFESTKGYFYLCSLEFDSHLKGPVDGRPSFALSAALDKLFALHNKLKPWKAAVKLHACDWLCKRMQNRKQEKALLGFDDLIEGLNDALDNDVDGALKAAIREQFPAILIDEFQDTDDIQYQIFDKIYDVSKHSQDTCVLLIGDPKQAIYSFRGGDIFTYLRASEAVGNNKFTLAKNYRSSEEMVDAVNHLFSASEERSEQGAFLFKQDSTQQDHNNNDDLGKQALRFESVSANGLKDEFVIADNAQTALQFRFAAENLDNESIANSVASEIVNLLNLASEGKAGFKQVIEQHDGSAKTSLKRIVPSDIAILVNSGTEAKALKEAFAHRNMRTYYSSDKSSILNTTEATELLTWLKAIAEPKYIAGLRAAIGTSLLRQSHRLMQKNLTDERYLDALIVQFSHFNSSWQTRGVLPMLKEFLTFFNVQSSLLRDQVVGERILTNILHIAEVLQEASLQIDGMNNLLRHYEHLLLRLDEDKDILKPRLESESGLIQIVTLHKSKGLQYPIVFLPFATSPFKKPEKNQIHRYHDENKQLKITITPNEQAVKLTFQEALAEDIRKLYVALTRAKYCTIVGVSKCKRFYDSALYYIAGVKSQKEFASAFLALAESSTNIATCDFYQKSDTLFVEDDAPTLGDVKHVKRCEKTYWGISSYSNIAYDKHDVRTEFRQQQLVEDEQLFADKAFKEFAESENLPMLIANSPGMIDADATEIQATQIEAAQAENNRELNLYSFHKGALAGTFLHNILEWCCIQGFEQIVNDEASLRAHISEQSELLGWSEFNDVLLAWMLQLMRQTITLTTPVPVVFSLDCLQSVQAEMEFLFTTHSTQVEQIDALVTQYILPGHARPRALPKQLNGAFKGFIDLTFEYNGQYYVLDYKGNHLGDTQHDYTQDAMRDAILSHRYDLQFVIYTLALHRLLKSRLHYYDYEQHVGGAIYYFLRGVASTSGGIYFEQVPFELIDKIDALFSGQAEIAEAE